jgi:radical SAM protein with 4Fe4S-binding SPASM domain
MAILHDGAIVPCNMLPTMVMGKIGETRLDEAWLTGREIHVLRERFHTPVITIPGCENCDFAGFCTGGCPAVIFARQGTLQAVDLETCYKKYVEEQHVSL